jgi:Arc/MetJ-type ribon-helix-helix transcriptional regulator
MRPPRAVVELHEERCAERVAAVVGDEMTVADDAFAETFDVALLILKEATPGFRRPRLVPAVQPPTRKRFRDDYPCFAVRPIHIPSIWMVYGWKKMASSVRELRAKGPDSEKITINLGFVDLGHIDLLVREGFYSNRTDFIRSAIRNQLDRHTDAVKQVVARHQLDLGLRRYSRQDLEAVRAAGETLHIQVLGLAVIAPDVFAELARDTIASIHVLGALQASPAVKAALQDRIR